MSISGTLSKAHEKKIVTSVDFLKFMGALAMVFAHCYIFLYRLIPNRIDISQLNFINKLAYLNGLYSLILPAMAGVVFRDTLNPYIQNNKIKNLPPFVILQSCVALMILESLKSAITFGFKYAFRWDVLHFTALSFYLLSILLIRWNLTIIYYAIALLLAGCMIINNALAFSTLNMHFEKYIDPNVLFVVYLLSLISIFIFILRLYKFKKFKLKLYFFLCACFLFKFTTIYFSDFELQVILINLPLSIFVQLGQYGGHIWPLFPWIILIFTGFILRDWQIKNLLSFKKRILIILLSFSAFYYFFIFQFKLYSALLTKISFFSPLYFRPNAYIIFEILCFFICVFYLYDLIFSRLKWKCTIVKEISEGILIFYIVHIFLAWKLLPHFFQLVPTPWLYWVYPFSILFLSYCFLNGVLLLSNKLIWFRFKKKNT
jgi:hypothetical protein